MAAINGTSGSDMAGVTATTPAWRILALAIRFPGRRSELIRQLWFMWVHREPTATESEMLERLMEKNGVDWRAWMLAPQGRDAPFAFAEHSHRPAYATLAYNLDIPTPYDEYVRQENRLVTRLFGGLFPAKGYIPAPVVVAYVRQRDL